MAHPYSVGLTTSRRLRLGGTFSQPGCEARMGEGGVVSLPVTPAATPAKPSPQISQSCARTHLLRTARHDNILGFIEESCRENLHDYVREPTIPTSEGVRRPDLIVKIGECAYVVDLTISSDHVHLSTPYQAKVPYYDRYDIRQWVLTRFGCRDVTFSAIVYSWHGCTLPESVSTLDRIGMSRYKQIIPIIRVLTYTANMHRLFNRSTTRHG